MLNESLFFSLYSTPVAEWQWWQLIHLADVANCNPMKPTLRETISLIKLNILEAFSSQMCCLLVTFFTRVYLACKKIWKILSQRPRWQTRRPKKAEKAKRKDSLMANEVRVDQVKVVMCILFNTTSDLYADRQLIAQEALHLTVRVVVIA